MSRRARSPLWRALVVLSVLGLLTPLTACGAPGYQARTLAATPLAVASRMSDEDLVGQVLVPFAYGDGATSVSAAAAQANRALAGVDTPAAMVARYRLGGLILIARSIGDPTAGTSPAQSRTSNLVAPDQIRRLTAGLQDAARKLPAGVPLLLGTDQEYGLVTRIPSGVTQLPSAMGMGAADDPALTEQAWAAAGADLAALGINTDFAPDSDVLAPGGAGVIGSRSFGADPDRVSAQVAAAVRGLHEGGVAATLKHFPGHGHTATDSHTNLPVLNQSEAELDSGDLPPFRAGIGQGADLVMSGHLDVRAIDPGVPASFSSKVLGLLRGQLGFQGVVITDALDMAPAERWSPGEAAVRAILAGNDMLLQPPDLAAAQRGLLDALASGRLPRARLIQSVTRILTLKGRLRAGPDSSTVDTAARQAVAAQAAARAVTVLSGPCSGPLVSGPVTVASTAGHAQQRAWLSEALTTDGVPVASGGTRIQLVGYGDDGTPSDAAVTVAMDTPYLLGSVTSAVRVATFATTQASMTALAAVLSGRAAAQGRAPVDVPGLPRTGCPH